MLLLVSVCCQSLSLGVLTGVNAAHNNINFVVALVLLLVSMCCDTAQALVFLPVSVCCDTAEALVILLVSVCCDTPYFDFLAGVSVL